jgi:hypothetical protein
VLYIGRKIDGLVHKVKVDGLYIGKAFFLLPTYKVYYILVEKFYFSTCLRRLKMFFAIFFIKNNYKKHFKLPKTI